MSILTSRARAARQCRDRRKRRGRGSSGPAAGSASAGRSRGWRSGAPSTFCAPGRTRPRSDTSRSFVENTARPRPSGEPSFMMCNKRSPLFPVSFIIIDPAGMVPLVALRRTKKPVSARAGTCRDHAINGPRSWTTQSRGTPAIDAQRLNWLRRRRAIRSGDEAHPLAATRRLLRSVMVGA